MISCQFSSDSSPVSAPTSLNAVSSRMAAGRNVATVLQHSAPLRRDLLALGLDADIRLAERPPLLSRRSLPTWIGLRRAERLQPDTLPFVSPGAVGALEADGWPATEDEQTVPGQSQARHERRRIRAVIARHHGFLISR